MIDYDSFSRCHLTDIFFRFSRGSKRVLTFLCDDSQPRTLRPIVPTGFRRTIFNKIHNLSHPGTKTTFKTISKRYVWPNMKRVVLFWCRNCVQCQRAKVTRHNYAPLQRYPQHLKSFDNLMLIYPVHFQTPMVTPTFWS